MDQNTYNQLNDIAVRELKTRVEKIETENAKFYPAIQKDIKTLLDTYVALGKITAELGKKIETLENKMNMPTVLPEVRPKPTIALLSNLFKKIKK